MDVQTLREKLKSDRGSYRVIAKATGVCHGAIVKLASGFTAQPFGRTIKALTKYYEAQDKQ